MNNIKFCRKRDGSIVPFDKKAISNAINKAFSEANEGNRILASKIAESVVEAILRGYQDEIPEVEAIQDIVEDTLMNYNFKMTAKKYILYRNERNKNRSSA